LVTIAHRRHPGLVVKSEQVSVMKSKSKLRVVGDLFP